MVDRFARWPEVVPVSNACAAAIARMFMFTWVARFGVRAVITTDQGKQFESSLWRELAPSLGARLAPTTAYHPQTNGLVERLYRQRKGALTAHALSSRSCFKALPLILLGLRYVINEGLQHSPAQLVHGSPLHLAGVFFGSVALRCVAEHRLKIFFDSVLPTSTRRGTLNKWSVPKQLETCTHVYLLRDATRPPLSPTYDGPYRYLPGGTKQLILCGDKLRTVSINRVKQPAFIDPTRETPERHAQFSPSVEVIPRILERGCVEVLYLSITVRVEPYYLYLRTVPWGCCCCYCLGSPRGVPPHPKLSMVAEKRIRFVVRNPTIKYFKIGQKIASVKIMKATAAIRSSYSFNSNVDSVSPATFCRLGASGMMLLQAAVSTPTSHSIGKIQWCWHIAVSSTVSVCHPAVFGLAAFVRTCSLGACKFIAVGLFSLVRYRWYCR
ncbi:hypothetical protein M514_02504 [Trichuris suis]|uniref:Integrase catalytic domain-containing protein n=1 Tax=Trichuris suis TaxID=68888 RepID=A0A085NFC1_9BILA|nr:hypothetical protein M513_02504 [Trichuris suis]KFD68167.1 hypothetical protein M514_02504 [Trichuris suis]